MSSPSAAGARRLPVEDAGRLFVEAGLAEVTVEPVVFSATDLAAAERTIGLAAAMEHAAGALAPGAAAAWWRSVTAAAGGGRFFCAITAFLVAGRAR